MSAGISGQKLPLWAEFSFLILCSLFTISVHGRMVHESLQSHSHIHSNHANSGHCQGARLRGRTLRGGVLGTFWKPRNKKGSDPKWAKWIKRISFWLLFVFSISTFLIGLATGKDKGEGKMQNRDIRSIRTGRTLWGATK